MCDACRAVSVAKRDWCLLVMQVDDVYFMNRGLPMGLASSCAIYQRIYDGFAWLFMTLAPTCRVFHYLDDFLFRLIGKLTFLCRAVVPGRCFLRCTIGQLQAVLSCHAMARWCITDHGSSDPRRLGLAIISHGCSGQAVQVCDEPRPSRLRGGIGCRRLSWIRLFRVIELVQRRLGWPSARNISLLELYPICIYLHLWTDKFMDKAILVRTDNEALVPILSNMYSRGPLINSMLRAIALCSLSNNIVLQVIYIRGEGNSQADMLSRGVFCPMIRVIPLWCGLWFLIGWPRMLQ